MSAQDYNNGLITGLAMKGLPYGIYAMWQPAGISNDDTSSITIDFGRYIADLDVTEYINALYFIKSFADEQHVLEITGWERVDGTTIKFLLDDYFSCNGVITITYNAARGQVANLPSFIVDYVPTGVPMVIYLVQALTGTFTITPITLTDGFTESVSTSLRSPIEPGPSDSLSGCEFTITPVTLTHGLSDGSLQTILE